LPDGTRTNEFKGSVFLLPTVSAEEAAERYPNYHSCAVPSGKNYLRLVKKEEVEFSAL
jgi:1-Cys peroxiredoxin 6